VAEGKVSNDDDWTRKASSQSEEPFFWLRIEAVKDRKKYREEADL